MIVPTTGEDVTKDFGFTGSFAVSYGSAVTHQPARVAVTAVEDCAVTLWPYSAFDGMRSRHVEWQCVGRSVAELLYVRKENRELSFLLEDAKTRYERAQRELSPEFSRIPKHLLASYLGVTPESFSRLQRSASAKPSR